jgi:CopG antitoxin of type II toxin-antitoxin system
MTSKSENHTKDREHVIPKFTSYEEEANFWDTHSMSDDWDDLESVKVKFAKNLSSGVTIRFDVETLKELREYAHRLGTHPTTLARMWILERLHDITDSHSHPRE